MMKSEGIKVIALNKKASYDYFLFDTYEAGLVLEGSEIKSIREGRVNLKDSYVHIKNGEAFIINMHIANYEKSSFFLPSTTRTRKLLLNKIEINKIAIKINEKGFTIVPTRVYLKNGLAKLEIALAKGKHNYDKREVEKNKDINRNINKMLKEMNK
ncbi:MAG: SsrA-binding protein SmpB [Bacilli bacterium]|nr:SsrA-binding protein SmpB [Bacilli bacterium]